MIVEEMRGDAENFPVGMRVLAVDDDPTCLKLLETLLRKCHYNVTTTNQARIALKMIRENKERFDLVISDVHMPDMDGFKLLELVGLEMDLPVIMLSANSDPKLVMKGVTHGACDYLVKPIRIEELRNIWQHVVRRKKSDSKGQNGLVDQAKANQESGEGYGPLAGNTDQNGKNNRKRKDDEDEMEDNENDYEDPGMQKKPRVVWSIELHRKFVTAVNQLGIEKAVPKRILDMMNVEGLTRENVASHLQKYRLYLKRISTVASQQANMAAALGVKDSGFMHMGSLDGFGDFRTFSGARLSNVAVTSPYTNSGMLGRLNSPAYCVVAVESAGRQLPIAFLERIKDDFMKKYGGKASAAGPNSLKKEFGPKLKEQMQYCVDHPEEISQIAKVKAQVSEVKGVMMQNIEKVLDRGEKIELLVDKTDSLRSQAQDFRKQGTKMKRKMWVENMKIKLVVFGIVALLALLIFLSVCPKFKC